MNPQIIWTRVGIKSSLNISDPPHGSNQILDSIKILGLCVVELLVLHQVTSVRLRSADNCSGFNLGDNVVALIKYLIIAVLTDPKSSGIASLATTATFAAMILQISSLLIPYLFELLELETRVHTILKYLRKKVKTILKSITSI